MNYVERAENVVKSLYLDERGKKNRKGMITTSQIRNLLSGISDIFNDVVILDEGSQLPADIVDRVNYLKVQFVYESGRHGGALKNFIDKAGLIKEIENAAASKEAFIKMERYMEALVAYHKYYGGEDYDKKA